MKARETQRVGVIRLIHAAVKNKEIALGKELDDPILLSLLNGMAKKYAESIDLFTQGNRPDLVEKDTAELAIIRSYLPKPLTPEEVEKEIATAIKETGASSLKDMGTVMKTITEKFMGQVDGKKLSSLVREKLK